MDDVRYLLCSILGVARLVHHFSILPSPTVRDLVQVDAFCSELGQELRNEDNSCDVPCRDDVTTMSQLPQPKVIGLLIQKSRQWQAKRITPFDVQLLSEGRLTD